MNIEPITAAPRLYMRVATRVAEFIAEGGLKPGEQLPAERELAKMFNVSRPTVREAMIALELSGLIEVRTGSGVYITQHKPTLVLADKGIGPFEVLEMRRMIEPEAAALAAVRMGKPQLARLKKILSQMKQQKNTPVMQSSDKEFHTLIAASTENAAIAATIDWLWEIREQTELNKVFHARIVEEGIFPRFEQHEPIVAALIKGDAEKARKAMADHLDSAISRAADYFKQKTETSRG